MNVGLHIVKEIFHATCSSDKVKALIVSAKKRWASSSQSDQKSLWKKIHGLLGDHRKPDPLARLLNTFSSNLVAADAINSALCNVFQRESYDYQLPRNSLDKPYNDNPWLIDISVESVFWAIINYPAHIKLLELIPYQLTFFNA